VFLRRDEDVYYALMKTAIKLECLGVPKRYDLEFVFRCLPKICRQGFVFDSQFPILHNLLNFLFYLPIRGSCFGFSRMN
jgi:hypothetical protein